MSEYYDNPRFPHTLTIKRAKVDGDGIPVTDADGNPVFDPILTSSFGYRNNNTIRNAGDVVENTEKIALPRTTVNILANDIIDITDYCESYRAIVVKARTYNFGTNIWMRKPEN